MSEQDSKLSLAIHKQGLGHTNDHSTTLDDLPEPPAWMGGSLCAQTDPEAFFPEKGGSTRDAKKICASCEVRNQCLEYALENDERFGIWGGLSERERRKLKLKPNVAAKQRERERLLRSSASASSVAALLGLSERTVFRLREQTREQDVS